MPSNWTGPILIRSGSYLKSVQQLIEKYSTRVVHNAVVLLFALGILPENSPNPMVCTKATMWAMPEASSALYTMQFDNRMIHSVIERVCGSNAFSARIVRIGSLFTDGIDIRGAEGAFEARAVAEGGCTGEAVAAEGPGVQLADPEQHEPYRRVSGRHRDPRR